MSHRRKHRFKLKSLYVWHRYVGLAAAALVIVLALTGIPLNHTERLALDGRFVRSSWLLDWYAIPVPEEYRAFTTGAGPVTLLGSRLYLRETAVAGDYQELHGAVESRGMLVVAVDSTLLLYTLEHELIENLTVADGLPEGIERVGLGTEGEVVVFTRAGNLQADADLLQWTPRRQGTDDVDWSLPMQLDTDQRRALAEQYRARILPYERVLLDLHSGRIFGRYGPWVMDAAAVLMVFLAGSGVLIWLKRKR